MSAREKKPLLRLDPVTAMRFRRFRQIRRGWWSFLVLVGLIALSLVAELFINSKALVVSHGGKLSFPVFEPVRPGTDFGLPYAYETDYRELRAKFAAEGGGWVLMPLVPWNPLEQDFRAGKYPPTPPSFADGHFLGTDKIGRDVLARLVYGFRISITFAMLEVAVTLLAGTLLGVLMGYLGGVFDMVFQRFIEIWEEIPFLYVIMILSAIFHPNFLLFLGIFILFGWTSKTWTVRAMTYRERERDYVLAARSMGASTWRIITVHIIPNVLVVIVTMLPFSISAGISSLAAFDYLGFGLPPPTPSWGELVAQGVSKFSTAPWILASIVTAMSTVLVMIAFVGEGLRDAFDPKKFTVFK